MTDEEREKMRAKMVNWVEVEKVMKKLRRDEVRNSNLAESIKIFDDAFRSAIWLNKPLPTSGFVDFHRILGKTR
jgi:hypothetical protein